MIYTTLNKIRAHNPCADGWEKLLSYLGKTESDDEPLPMSVILDSNGLDDALWCLRSVPEHDREWRLFACWCARRVAHLNTDPRVMAAIETTERFARGECDRDELSAAEAAARDAEAAAWAATRSARAAAGAAWAAEAAAEAAAGAAAWAARSAAAWAARSAAAEAAAWAAAEAAEYLDQTDKLRGIFDMGVFTDKETTT